MKDVNLQLIPVLEHEEQVEAIISESLSYFNRNMPGPAIYCSTYEKYNYIMLAHAKMDLLEFFKQEFFPPLKVRIVQFP